MSEEVIFRLLWCRGFLSESAVLMFPSPDDCPRITFTADDLSDTSSFKYFMSMCHAVAQFEIFHRNPVCRQARRRRRGRSPLCPQNSFSRNPALSHSSQRQSSGLISVTRCCRSPERRIDSSIEVAGDQTRCPAAGVKPS